VNYIYRGKDPIKMIILDYIIRGMKEDKNLSEKEFGNTFEGKMDSEYIL